MTILVGVQRWTTTPYFEVMHPRKWVLLGLRAFSGEGHSLQEYRLSFGPVFEDNFSDFM